MEGASTAPSAVVDGPQAAVDGRDSVLFLARVKELVEDAGRLLLEG